MSLALVAAPTNLGLHPPEPGAVPGTAKAPEALREAGLHARLVARGAIEAGVVLPGRYVDDDGRRAPGRTRNEAAIVDHARRLADRLCRLRGEGHVPLVLGGDCSLLLGAGLASRRLGGGGLVHLDGHTDFRHPGNSSECASLAGEDLAVAVGRHTDAVADVDGLRPYLGARSVAHVGCRDEDEHLEEVSGLLGAVVPASMVVEQGAAAVAAHVRPVLGARWWLQLDVDVLDPWHMPAVDSPDPGGLDPDQLVGLLRELAPGAWGAAVTVFDPDLDPDGSPARLLADIVVAGLADLGRDVRTSPP